MGFPSWSLCCFNNGSFSAQGKKYSVKKLEIGSHPVPVSAHVSACVYVCVCGVPFTSEKIPECPAEISWSEAQCIPVTQTKEFVEIPPGHAY